MNQIYLYDGVFEKGDEGWPLVREAAVRYGLELNVSFDFSKAQIQRTEKGKPFFVDGPVDFSLSHSGAMWMCFISGGSCGLDLQIVETHRDWQRICERKYTAEEQHYVALWGIEGFYRIWVRKEAFGKCTGNGIFSSMPSMVDENGDLPGCLEYEGVKYFIEEVDILPEVKCAYCVTEPGVAELRILA